MSETEIQALEMELYEKTLRLHELKKQLPSRVVPDYSFSSLNGDVSLRELFAGKETLLAIHNMGQGCRYCTLWGDGMNGFLPHMEAHVAVVMLSKDDPETQQRFANSRQWRFRMVSHGGGVYAEEQSAQDGLDLGVAVGVLLAALGENHAVAGSGPLRHPRRARVGVDSRDFIEQTRQASGQKGRGERRA